MTNRYWRHLRAFGKTLWQQENPQCWESRDETVTALVKRGLKEEGDQWMVSVRENPQEEDVFSGTIGRANTFEGAVESCVREFKKQIRAADRWVRREEKSRDSAGVRGRESRSR